MSLSLCQHVHNISYSMRAPFVIVHANRVSYTTRPSSVILLVQQIISLVPTILTSPTPLPAENLPTHRSVLLRPVQLLRPWVHKPEPGDGLVALLAAFTADHLQQLLRGGGGEHAPPVTRTWLLSWLTTCTTLTVR